MDEKSIIVVAALLISVAFVGAVIAAILIESSPVEVTVSDYTLTITDPPDGTIYDTYTFTGFLMLDGTPIEGEVITLYIDEGSGFVTTGQTDTTLTDGSYSITWTPTQSGTFTFKTQVAI